MCLDTSVELCTNFWVTLFFRVLFGCLPVSAAGSEGIDESLGLYKLCNLKCFADTYVSFSMWVCTHPSEKINAITFLCN